MSRTFLFSLLIIGIVCGFAGRATYASFTATQVASGGISAGTLRITAEGGPTLVFDEPYYNGCPNDVVFNEGFVWCYAYKTVSNQSSLAGVFEIDYENSYLEVEGEDCSSENFGYWFYWYDPDGDSYKFPPGDEHVIYAEIYLDSYYGFCFGATATLHIVTTVVQADDPHSTDDTCEGEGQGEGEGEGGCGE
jgi:predicted ribosomally synthesized peptide with SipW-like signal peptide